MKYVIFGQIFQMRTLSFILFFGIVFLVYGLINSYIFIRGLRTMEAGSIMRSFYIIVFWFLALSFIAGRILEKFYLSILSDLFTWAGSFWLAGMLYLFLAVLLFDLLRLLNLIFPFFHYFSGFWFYGNSLILTIFTASAVFLIVLGGHLNALNPRVKEIQIPITQVAKGSELRIIMASDIHLGTIISTRRITRMVKLINGLKPDAIVLAGDVVDEDLAPVIRQDLGSILATLEAPLGVYGITGNHEYIGGAVQAVEYLRSHGIHMLSDTMVSLAPKIFLAGREDIDSRRFSMKKRASLKSFTAERGKNSFLIVLDHQPRAIPEAVEAGVGLLLCGHTHHGQLWPLNYITNAVFPLSWGLKAFASTMVYVSSGLGSWGPPVRIGNRPEVVLIKLIGSDMANDAEEESRL